MDMFSGLWGDDGGGGSGSGGGGGGGGGGGTPTTVVPKRRTLLARTEIDEDTYVAVDFLLTPTAGNTIVFEGYLNATATNPRAVAVLPVDTFLKLANLAAAPTNSAGLLAVYWRETDDTGVTNNTDEFYIGRGADDAVYLRDRNSDVFVEVYEEYLDVTGGTGSRGPAGPPGGGGAPGWIEPKDEYVADDLGKFLLEHGVLKHIVLEAHAGHSRVVEFQTLANAVSALDADGVQVSTGGAGNFLGFFANVSAIPALSISDEVWAAFTAAGDFEIQDPTGFYSSEHWNSYNPFRGSGDRPWATITLADATTQDHVPFTDPDTGIVSDWRIVNTTDHAERFTTAVGEAFFIQDEQQIRMVTAYTPHEAGEVQYVSEPYYSPGVLKPVGVFFGVGQTEEWPSDFPNEQMGSALRRMAFAADGPHDGWDGGLDGRYDDIFVAAADVDADIDTGLPAAATDNVVFNLPVGRYTIEVWWTNNNLSGDQTVGLVLAEVTSGADDVQLGLGVGFSNDIDVGDTETIFAGIYLKRTVVLAGDEQLYIGVVGLLIDADTRHYMQITKVQ